MKNKISSRKKQRKPTATEDELFLAKKVLYRIAHMGYGMKDEIRDWTSIGRNAVFEAREYLSGKCKECGRTKEWKP